MYKLIQRYLRGRTAVKIAEGIENAIQDGVLAPEDPLPTVRALAERLEVSPTTIASAYKTLRTRGLVVGEGRRGTRVSERPPLTSRPALAVPLHVRNLADGNPDPALLPDLGPVLRSLKLQKRLYGEHANLPALVELVAQVFRTAGAPRGPVGIVAGALDGIERVLQAHLRTGDRVAVEDPGFPDVLDLVRALGLVPVPLAVDAHGPVPASLASLLERGVRACVVTPRAQNPTGAALTGARERALRRVLKDHADVLVIEDDHAGPVAGAEARTLCTAERRRYAIVRSVSKFLGPDLRLAFLAGDPNTVARVEGRQRLGTSWVSHILQAAVYSLLRARRTETLLKKATRTYARRRAALLDALAREGIEGHGRSGLHVWIPVADEGLTVQGLMDAGWAVAAGERFRLRSPPAIRVTFAALRAHECRRFAEDLAGVLDSRSRTHAA